jgi:AmmeMemoRadiSam system protein B
MVDQPLSQALMKNCPLLEEDLLAHHFEHSLEVQIPFLQYLKMRFTFVPVTLGSISYEQCREVGLALARTIKSFAEPVLMIASSDMNHYEKQAIAEEKDRLAINEILNLDPEGLYNRVKEKNISMCGIMPTTVMLVAAKELGAKKAELVKHATSGDVTGDYGSVVGYASLIVS